MAGRQLCPGRRSGQRNKYDRNRQPEDPKQRKRLNFPGRRPHPENNVQRACDKRHESDVIPGLGAVVEELEKSCITSYTDNRTNSGVENRRRNESAALRCGRRIRGNRSQSILLAVTKK